MKPCEDTAAPSLLLLIGRDVCSRRCSSIQRDPPIQIW